MDVRKGVKNIVYSILGQAITMILGIVIPRLVIVSYGSEVNGLLTSVSQVIGYLALLEAGVGAAALQALYRPISDDNHDGINAIISATHRYYRRTGIIYFALTVVMSFVYPLVIKAELDYWFMAVIILICGIPNVINYFFQGKLKIFLNAVGDNYILTNLSTITSVGASLAKIGLLLLGVNVIAVQAIYCVISLVQMIFIYAYVKRKYPWINVKVEPDNEALTQKNSTLIHQVCGLVMNGTDVVVISIFCSLASASIYATYNMIYVLIFGILTSITNGIAFIIGDAYCKDQTRFNRIMEVYEAYFAGVVSAFMCTTYILITPFISLYTTRADLNYTDEYLPVLFSVLYIMNSLRYSSSAAIVAAGHFKQTQHHAIIESVINLSVSVVSVIALNFIGCGIYGVLLGTIVALIYRNIVSIGYSNKHILQKKNLFSIKNIAVNAVMVAIVIVIGRFIKLDINNYVDWLVYAFITTGIIFLGFITAISVTNIKQFKEIYSYLCRKIKRKNSKENE